MKLVDETNNKRKSLTAKGSRPSVWVRLLLHSYTWRLSWYYLVTITLIMFPTPTQMNRRSEEGARRGSRHQCKAVNEGGTYCAQCSVIIYYTYICFPMTHRSHVNCTNANQKKKVSLVRKLWGCEAPWVCESYVHVLYMFARRARSTWMDRKLWMDWLSHSFYLFLFHSISTLPMMTWSHNDTTTQWHKYDDVCYILHIHIMRTAQ